MNGLIKMYPIRQIIRHDVNNIPLPDCMYKLKNLHQDKCLVDHVLPTSRNLDISEQKNQDHSAVMDLIRRQEIILQHLSDLKAQMQSIRDCLGMKTESTAFTSSIKIPACPEIILKANPDKPPYCLLIVQKLFEHVLNIQVASHLHSSVDTLPTKALDLSHDLVNFKPQNIKIPKLHIRLIWKAGSSDFEMIASNTPIKGEVNFLRYLTRLNDTVLLYETIPNVYEIDQILDLCYNITNVKTKTQRTAQLRDLNKKLGKSQWFYGLPKMSVADVAVYSTLKQIEASEVNQTMTKWLQLFNQVKAV